MKKYLVNVKESLNGKHETHVEEVTNHRHFIRKLLNLSTLSSIASLAVALISLNTLKLMQEQHSLNLVKENKVETRHYRERKTNLLEVLYKDEDRHSVYSSRMKSEAFVELLFLEQDKIDLNMIHLLEHDSRWIKNPSFDFGKNFSNALLSGIDIQGQDLSAGIFYGTDLSHASLTSSNFLGAIFEGADLSFTNLSDIKNWDKKDFSFVNANIYGVKNPPKGFRKFALANGACEFKNKAEWLNYKENVKLWRLTKLNTIPVCKKGLPS
jgi:hypothetical protein